MNNAFIDSVAKKILLEENLDGKVRCLMEYRRFFQFGDTYVVDLKTRLLPIYVIALFFLTNIIVGIVVLRVSHTDLLGLAGDDQFQRSLDGKVLMLFAAGILVQSLGVLFVIAKFFGWFGKGVSQEKNR